MLSFINKDETIVGACGFTAKTSGTEGHLALFKCWGAPPSIPLHTLYDGTPAALADFPPEDTI